MLRSLKDGYKLTLYNDMYIFTEQIYFYNCLFSMFQDAGETNIELPENQVF